MRFLQHVTTRAFHGTLTSLFVTVFAELMECIGLFGCVLGVVHVMTFSTGRRRSLLFLKLMVTVCTRNGITGIRGMPLMVKEDAPSYGGEKNSDGFFGGLCCERGIANYP
jgi:hypothetical protein